MTPPSNDRIYNAIGFSGSTLAALSQVANIVRVHRRNRSKDMSYTYQFMLATGILFLDVYYVYYKSVQVLPTTVSLILILYVTGLKCYIEMFRTPRKVTAGGRATPEHFEHTVLLEVAERSDDKGDTIGGYGAAHRVALRAVLVTEVYEHASDSKSGPLAKGDLIMLRAKKEAHLQDKSGRDSRGELMVAKFMATIEENLSGFDERLEEVKMRLERMAKTRSAVQARVLTETSRQRHGASKDGVTQNTPQTGTRMLQVKGQLSTCRHEKDQHQVAASRPGYRNEKGSEPGGEFIRGGVVKDTAPSNPSEPQTSHMCQQQSGRHLMKFMVHLFDPSRVTITGMPVSMGQPSENRLAARVSMWSRYRRAPVPKAVQNPSSRKRRPSRRPTSSRYGVFRPRWQSYMPQRPHTRKSLAPTYLTKPDRSEDYRRE